MRFFSWPSVAFCSLLIFLFSVLPVKVSVDITHLDKILHGLIYCFLSFLVLNTALKKGRKHTSLISFGYAFSLGLLIELVQVFLPFRDFESADIAANFLGSFLGCWLKLI